MEQKFDIEKLKEDGMRCRTISGYPVRILCTDRKSQHGYCLVGVIDINGEEKIQCWTENGGYYLGAYPISSYNLVNLPRVKQIWVNVYKTADKRLVRGSYKSEERAKNDIKIFVNEYETYIKTVLVDEWEE